MSTATEKEKVEFGAGHLIRYGLSIIAADGDFEQFEDIKREWETGNKDLDAQVAVLTRCKTEVDKVRDKMLQNIWELLRKAYSARNTRMVIREIMELSDIAEFQSELKHWFKKVRKYKETHVYNKK